MGGVCYTNGIILCGHCYSISHSQLLLYIVAVHQEMYSLSILQGTLVCIQEKFMCEGSPVPAFSIA